MGIIDLAVAAQKLPAKDPSDPAFNPAPKVALAPDMGRGLGDLSLGQNLSARPDTLQALGGRPFLAFAGLLDAEPPRTTDMKDPPAAPGGGTPAAVALTKNYPAEALSPEEKVNPWRERDYFRAPLSGASPQQALELQKAREFFRAVIEANPELQKEFDELRAKNPNVTEHTSLKQFVEEAFTQIYSAMKVQPPQPAVAAEILHKLSKLPAASKDAMFSMFKAVGMDIEEHLADKKVLPELEVLVSRERERIEQERKALKEQNVPEEKLPKVPATRPQEMMAPSSESQSYVEALEKFKYTPPADSQPAKAPAAAAVDVSKSVEDFIKSREDNHLDGSQAAKQIDTILDKLPQDARLDWLNALQAKTEMHILEYLASISKNGEQLGRAASLALSALSETARFAMLDEFEAKVGKSPLTWLNQDQGFLRRGMDNESMVRFCRALYGTQLMNELNSEVRVLSRVLEIPSKASEADKTRVAKFIEKLEQNPEIRASMERASRDILAVERVKKVPGTQTEFTLTAMIAAYRERF